MKPMKKWVTTSGIYRTLGETVRAESSKTSRWSDGLWSKHYHDPNYAALEKGLNEVMAFCNREQMSAKAMFPLASAQTFEYGEVLDWSNMMTGSMAGAGVGQGWAFSNIVGFAVLLERVEE